MEIRIIGLFIMLAASQALPGSDEGKRIIDSVSLKTSAGDVRGLMDILPDLELLWAKEPETYFKSMRLAAPVLVTVADPEAKAVALTTFANVMNKTAPGDTVGATSYFRDKDTFVGNFLNIKEVREDQARLLMVAGFVGEIRSRRILGYQNQGTNLPGFRILDDAGVREPAELPTADLKEAYAQAVKQNANHMEMNRLQNILFSADGGLMSYLQVYAKAFSAKEPENRGFYQELVKRAKLTEKEQKELYTPR